jgi:hypothetical protein
MQARRGGDGMPNRNLTVGELVEAHKLLTEIRSRIDQLAGDDPHLKFAYRRKIVKEQGYDERSKPSVRNKLKMLKWGLR